MSDETQSHIRPARANLADVALVFITFFRGCADAAVDAWNVMEAMAASHSEYTMQKQSFAREAGADIERLTGGEDG
jgi:hypothetical protein